MVVITVHNNCCSWVWLRPSRDEWHAVLASVEHITSSKLKSRVSMVATRFKLPCILIIQKPRMNLLGADDSEAESKRWCVWWYVVAASFRLEGRMVLVSICALVTAVCASAPSPVEIVFHVDAHDVLIYPRNVITPTLPSLDPWLAPLENSMVSAWSQSPACALMHSPLLSFVTSRTRQDTPLMTASFPHPHSSFNSPCIYIHPCLNRAEFAFKTVCVSFWNLYLGHHQM